MVKRVFVLVLFSCTTMFFVGCGDSGTPVADNMSDNPTVMTDRGASSIAETNRRKTRARLPLEARKNSQIETRSRPDVASAAAEPDPNPEALPPAESAPATDDDTETSVAPPTVPVSTAANQPPKSGTGSGRPNIGALGDSSSAPPIPAMAEPTGNKGIEAGDDIIEIEGQDIDGEAFALSDYSGKVVMLDFWGDW